MGQYWKPVNLDKKETLDAHTFGDGLKLCEMAGSGCGVAGALMLLLSPLPGPRGGGDPHANTEVLGRWAGDRVVMAGDYSEDSDMPGVPEFSKLYAADLTDISDIVAPYMRAEFPS